MKKLELYHGSEHIIKKPLLGVGKVHNDYGQGFYCTRSMEMSKEWACKNNKDGFVNRYELNTTDLKILNLQNGDYTILNWIALLLKNRTFTLGSDIAVDAKAYIIEHFLVDVSLYDVVVGYRADDSYFSYAEAFVENGLPLRSLNMALYLGKLGEQTVLVSEKAFQQLVFTGAEKVDKKFYYSKYLDRDTSARETYRNEIRSSKSYREDIFVMDILREEMKNDDLRIQRIIFE